MGMAKPRARPKAPSNLWMSFFVPRPLLPALIRTCSSSLVQFARKCTCCSSGCARSPRPSKTLMRYDVSVPSCALPRLENLGTISICAAICPTTPEPSTLSQALQIHA
eukprot:scaffold301_cov243-Pinguiococcus_pyrenoidosus.AAC.62